MTPNRKLALTQLIDKLRSELEIAKKAQRFTQAGATHEEAKPENDKDTRATEASYLARGQAERVGQMQEDVALLELLQLHDTGDLSRPRLGVICQLDLHDEAESRFYFLAPAGAGTHLTQGDLGITVLTSKSPLGSAILKAEIGDDVMVPVPRGKITAELAGLF